MTPVPQLGSRLRPVGSAPEGPSTLVSRRNWPVLVFALVFASCILFAYCWFNTDIGRPSPGSAPYAARRASSLRFTSPGIWLTARTNLPGYTFVSEPVSDAVKETLGTTNILSGTFYRTEDGDRKSEIRNQTTRVGDANLVLTSDIRPPHSVLRPLASDRITVFLATWSAESKKPLLMLGHTPDICWTGAGWKPIDLGQPRQVLIDLPTTEGRSQRSEPASDVRHLSSGTDLRPPSSRPLPFSCRAFESPDRTTRELAVWCTLIDGQPLTDSIPSERASVQVVTSDAHVRMTILDRLLRATRQRLPVRGEKQFVRYSMPMNGDWQMTLEQSKSLVPFHLQSEFANKTPI